MENKLYLSAPHMSGNEQKYIQEAFDLNWIAPLGNNVNEFEKIIADYNSVAGASVVTSGTSAIHLALRLLGVEENDSIICSSLTFVASANPILYQGAKPIFIDSEPDTWNMCPEALRRALKRLNETNELPKAAIIVNLYGQPAKMEELIDICTDYEVSVIEDAAESLGSEYKGQKSGTFGDFGIFSFNGNKIITTSGGGALISNNKEALDKSRFLATQARDNALHYQHSELGYNYRMSNIVAGIGRAQLEILDLRVQQRRNVYKRYYEELSNLPGFYFMPELEGTKSNRWLTALTVDPNEAGVTSLDIIEALGEENIEARPVWKPLHLQPLFEGVPYYPHQENYSVSDKLFKYGLCLPSGSNMEAEDQERVISIIKELVKERN
ncbi:DegT/DnrJ/EryC1/StrS aminotransferase family protein [Halobacillus sp. Marseille-Q1614]|uniref:DegT/DnrJ/EryC1/StrS family aminotransferase n=1 Tax=Halobacillus sp. Marseille-Q1614 TaxID=2709134 RepID=UPI00156F0477|nr:aminotransferase class I/II-fold pyridoxal phosphate-dependent enzyme [Halobacillus sp. Marseille-Q1614]